MHFRHTVLLTLAAASVASAQDRPNRANWALADKFAATSLRPIVYSSAINPRWLGQSDSLCYNWKNHNGSVFYMVVPTAKSKRPVFDQENLAAQLSDLSHHAHDPSKLPFTTISFSKDRKTVSFVADSSRWEWTFATETLKRLGPAATAGGRGGRGAQGVGRGNALVVTAEADSASTCGGGGGRAGGGGGGGGGQFGGRGGNEFRNFSPDSSLFAFAREHNLYLVNVAKKDTVQLTRDGAKNYSFGARDTIQDQQQQQLQDEQQQQQDDTEQGGGRGRQTRSRDPRVRANVVWAPDSKAFVVTRMDSRKVGELFLVNNIANPRPTLMSYSYAMPGEENVAQEELFAFRVGDTKLTPVNVKRWKDQRTFDVHWNASSTKLRLVRRDRTQRHLELIEVDLQTHTISSLIREDVENSSTERQNIRYVKGGGDLLWWSERTGWGHYYLYDNAGHLKRALTSGPWRAERIVALDSIKGIAEIAGVGRESGENPYYSHLYRVHLDGTGGTALLDAGEATHNSTLSPNRKWIVDNYSRIDLVPRVVLRDASGKIVMDLETMDVSKLQELGWKAPERFQTKAADGVTDIYGNLWKPFDFDSTKTYPIIANVYPGPQTESVTFPFAPTAVPQQLAQLGFIVIQIGNRGGSPQRSQEYQSYSYFNLRDYALADKKAGIEQLAARHKWIDLDRVGIYGHSGGGFLTAAAMLLPPYNDFFKVGVSESGNHDNNIYNQNWSEQYHGLKVVAKNGDKAKKALSEDNGAAPDDTTDSAFQIRVPTTVELAANLKGSLLLETGDMDNNVHPANTIRLVHALIKANKRFDFMLLPGKPHGYGDMVPYTNRLMFEYFAEHLMGDYYRKDAFIK
jgi:dipeptidyl-peptidase 4